MKRPRPGSDDWIRNTQRRLRNWVKKFLDSLRGRQLTYSIDLSGMPRRVRGTWYRVMGTFRYRVRGTWIGDANPYGIFRYPLRSGGYGTVVD